MYESVVLLLLSGVHGFEKYVYCWHISWKTVLLCLLLLSVCKLHLSAALAESVRSAGTLRTVDCQMSLCTGQP
jgi:hypothetical protein